MAKRERILAKSRLLLLALLAFLVLSAGGIYFSARKDVILEADGRRIAAHTFKTKVEELLVQQGIVLGTEDKIEPGLESSLADGLQVKVIRAFPVEVRVDGEMQKKLTTPITVANLLQKSGVEVGELDRVTPSPDALLQEETVVEITRVSQTEEEETRSIPYQIEKRPDSTLERGINKLVRRGKNGRERITYRVTYEEGIEVEREEIARDVVDSAVNEVVAIGSIQLASRGGTTFRFQKALVVTASAYSSTGYRTFLGTIPEVGTVAVDPKVIPLRSRVYIEGYGFAKAQDIGSAIRGDRIDVYLDTEAQARTWGMRKVKVYVLEN